MTKPPPAGRARAGEQGMDMRRRIGVVLAVVFLVGMLVACCAIRPTLPYAP